MLLPRSLSLPPSSCHEGLEVWERRGSNGTSQKETVALDPCEQVLLLSSGSALKYPVWFLSSCNYLLRCSRPHLAFGVWCQHSEKSTVPTICLGPQSPTSTAFSFQLSTPASTTLLHASLGYREASDLLHTEYRPWGTGYGVLCLLA